MSETPAALITALIVERPMCIDCIAKRVDLSVTATETAITMIQAALDVHRERAPALPRLRNDGRGLLPEPLMKLRQDPTPRRFLPEEPPLV